MKKELRKPEYWQDFETLCKKLWGEIWECDEIKKNGRTGQKQHGVDIYGIPNGKNEFWGIQCKGKSDYSISKLTKEEIDAEIIKALDFQPPLKKLYFATTANKDSEIEEYVRIKNSQNQKSGKFEIHLFSWEDIVDLIDENRKTYDWFVKNINHKTKNSIDVCFQDGSKEINFKPKLIKNHIEYIKAKDKGQSILHDYIFPNNPIEFNPDLRNQIVTHVQPKHFLSKSVILNKGTSCFSLKIKNTGSSEIENYKLLINFMGSDFKVEVVSKAQRILDDFDYNYNIEFNEDIAKGVFVPENKYLVPNDSISTDQICIRPFTENPIQVKLKWKLISKHFEDTGFLKLNLHTEIEDKKRRIAWNSLRNNEIVLENKYVEISH